MPPRSTVKPTLRIPLPTAAPGVPSLSSHINDFHIAFPKLVAAKQLLVSIDDPTSPAFSKSLLEFLELLVSTPIKYFLA